MGYGGGGANDDGMLEFYESSTSRYNPSILVDRCVITKSAKHGIWLVYESSPEITNCKIIDNYQDGIYTQQSRPALKNNEISGNNRYGVNNAYPYYEVDARQNYWGDASGPYHPVKNPSGKGNEVSDNVLFMPKLSSPAESFWTALENYKTAGESIIVYPNPAKSWFTMEFNSPQEAISVNLWDAGGNLVDVLLTDSFSAKKKHHVANLKPGIYFVEVITEQSRKYKKLIIAD
jgi:parallel beta-helix repeat protein